MVDASVAVDGDLCLFTKVRDGASLAGDWAVLERRKRFWVFADPLGGGRVWLPDHVVEAEGWLFVRVLGRANGETV